MAKKTIMPRMLAAAMEGFLAYVQFELEVPDRVVSETDSSG